MKERLTIKFDEKSNLVGYRWSNPKVEHKGTVQIAHGLSEHVSRYDAFADFLSNNGYTVIAFDHYNHGESVEELNDLGVIETYDFIEAVVKGLKLVRDSFQDDFDKQKILFSHSMGSISSQTYIQRYPDDFDKVIFSGTDVGDFRYSLLKILTNITVKKNDARTSTKFIHNLTFGNFQKKFLETSSFNWLSKNPENIKNYELDPLCGAAVSDTTYNSISRALKQSFKMKNIKKINPHISIFIFSGAEDPVSNFGKSVNKLYKKYRKADLNVMMKLYPTLRHETLNELEFQSIFDDVLSFIDNKTLL